MGSEGFSRFPNPYSLVGSDGFVPMSIIYIHIYIYIYDCDFGIGHLARGGSGYGHVAFSNSRVRGSGGI